MDIANDPIRVDEALLALEPPSLDFLPPHATWDSPPPDPPYAAWLSTIHDRWMTEPSAMDDRRELGRFPRSRRARTGYPLVTA